ncbi:uncharacterized protein SOCE26_079630 [Sorangium cellulosum]|uniref:Novel STAND NTPase 1 domain-containing protein n=1 Tax=Sorangium cellulosum TaxID=56 RepID=A0A2L0F4K8_SORCE|nr:protein kinase [Sorangium cellulosum]AUX46457.1 uncharacterized protein SOCE26_079630 [Sorangium cellulosum]
MNPFPGPRPYRAEDRSRFHGRDDQAKKLMRRVLAHPCVTLFGPSGAGKSSLMKAAVIPTLTEERAFRVVRVDGWPPGEAPVPWLVRELFAELDLGEAPADLGFSGRALEALDQALNLAEQRSDRPILIYLDQLEQVLFPGRSADEARTLVEAIDQLANKRIWGLHVVMSLRENYLGRFRDRARGRNELLDHGFRLGPLTVAEMTTAVCVAAANAGQAWDPAHVRKLMMQLRTPGQLEADEAEVQAAFGQIVSRALWERRAGGEAGSAGAEDAEEILRPYLEEILRPYLDEMNPFPGPRPYRAEDRTCFHGRDDQANKLARRVLAHPCVTLFGPSGAGKSSLMQAAVIPTLAEEHAFRVVRVDRWPQGKAPVPWLVRAIFAELDLGQAPADLGSSGRALDALDQALGLAEQRSDRPILIYLDQLEQVLFPERSADEARAIVEAVDRMANKRIRGLQVVMSLREDYLGRLRDRARGRRELLDHGFRLGPLTVAEMTRAVCEAAADAGQAWDEAHVRRLMLHVRTPGQHEGDEAEVDEAEVEAAFGQIVCRVLWERRASGALSAGAEDAEEILRRYMDQTLEELGPRKEAAQRFLEEHLVDPKGNRTLLTEQEALGALPVEAAKVLKHLEHAAVLKAEAHHGSRYFELGHDWLAKRVFERKKERKQQEEQARARNAQRTLIGIATGAVAVAVVMGALLVWALAMRKEAVEQRIAARDASVMSGIRELMARGDSLWARMLPIEVQRPAEQRAWFELTMDILDETPFKATLGHAGPVLRAQFSPDGKRVVTASTDNTARVWELDGSGKFTDLNGHAALVWSAAFSPDGKRVVTASADNTARVWELDGSGKFIDLNGHAAQVLSAAFSPDGKRVVTASWDTTARVWELDGSGKFIDLNGHAAPLWSAAFSPDGERVVTASADNTARVWELDGSGKFIDLNGHAAPLWSAAFSPDGKRVVTASADNTARVWELDGSGKFIDLNGHAAQVLSAAFSPDGKRVVTASWDTTARIWELDGSGKFIDLNGHAAQVWSAAFSPDGKRVVTASWDTTARIWELDGSGKLIDLKGHAAQVLSAAFSPDGKRVVTASDDKTARVWELDGSGKFTDLNGHAALVWSAAFSPDGKRVVTASDDKTARVWELDDSGKFIDLNGHAASIRSAAFSPDGKRVVTASDDKTARVWELDDLGKFIDLNGHADSVLSAAFSPDGKRVVTASHDKTARVWELDDSGKFIDLNGHADSVLSAAFSPDGKRVVTASDDKTARVWELDGSGKFIDLKGHAASIRSAAFSPDGERVVTASDDKTARVWELDGSGKFTDLKGHAASIRSAAFSPDGKRVVTASDDKTARVWELDGSGKFIDLKGHAASIRSAAFSPDGERVVTASWDTTARVWPVTIKALRELLRTASPGCLPVYMRQTYLVETDTEAREAYASCERSRSPAAAPPLLDGPPSDP